jgi:hypothetical protein
MRRYFIAPVIGTGTSSNPYRAKVGTIDASWTAWIPSGADGRPRLTWALIVADAPDLATDIADGQMFELTDRLDVSLSTLTTQKRNALRTRMSSVGVTIPADATLIQMTFGDLLRQIGRTFDPSFDPDRMNLTV